MKFRQQMRVTRIETWEIEADDIGQANAKLFRAEGHSVVASELEQWQPLIKEMEQMK